MASVSLSSGQKFIPCAENKTRQDSRSAAARTSHNAAEQANRLRIGAAGTGLPTCDQSRKSRLQVRGGPGPKRFKPMHLRGLAPAGRLDIDSSGLLVFTQDGRIARQLIGEDSEVEKEYLVRVEGRLPAKGLASIEPWFKPGWRRTKASQSGMAK